MLRHKKAKYKDQGIRLALWGVRLYITIDSRKGAIREKFGNPARYTKSYPTGRRLRGQFLKNNTTAEISGTSAHL